MIGRIVGSQGVLLGIVSFLTLIQTQSSHGQTVSGKVIDGSGNPVKQALVTFINEEDVTRIFSDVTDGLGEYSILLTSGTSVEESAVENPSRIRLYQNYPNPFNPSTTIPYQLSEPEFVSIIIYNALGQKVRTLREIIPTYPTGE